MRRALIAAMLAALLGANPVLAQVGGMGSPIPAINATSPFGIVPGSSVAPTGIPLGATELASPGLSPASTATIGMTGNGTTCSAVAGQPSGMSSSNTSFVGGGMGFGTATALQGSAAASVVCGTNSGSTVSSSAATSSPSPGVASRAGIPLGSVEIGNPGLSPMPVVPSPSLFPSATGSGTPCSTTGLSMSSTGC